MNITKIIESALKQLGVLAAGENAEANELVDAVDVLRGLLSQWATKRLYIHKVEQITLSLNGSAKVSPNNTDAPDYKTSISLLSCLCGSEPGSGPVQWRHNLLSCLCGSER